MPRTLKMLMWWSDWIDGLLEQFLNNQQTHCNNGNSCSCFRPSQFHSDGWKWLQELWVWIHSLRMEGGWGRKKKWPKNQWRIVFPSRSFTLLPPFVYFSLLLNAWLIVLMHGWMVLFSTWKSKYNGANARRRTNDDDEKRMYSLFIRLLSKSGVFIVRVYAIIAHY